MTTNYYLEEMTRGAHVMQSWQEKKEFWREAWWSCDAMIDWNQEQNVVFGKSFKLWNVSTIITDANRYEDLMS